MTTATLHTHAPVRTNVVSDYLHRLQEAYTGWREQRQAYAALARMSNHELKDIGLSRSDIDYVARNAVPRVF
jgi:uncharacterized protein YjiS (DUF1127 family)